MASDFINRLLDLVFSPYGLIGIGIGFIVLDKARHSHRLAWLLFSLCCYAASLGKYVDEWIKEAPVLVVPLQQLREMGRPLAIVLLALLIFLGMQTRKGWRRVLIPQPIYYLVVVQVAIFLKTFLYGDIGFALLAALTFGGVILMFRLGPCSWLQDEHSFHLGVWSLAMVGVIFALGCTYQGIFNMQAMTYTQGRFLGTTGNSQHAAVLLAGTIPSVMFLIENRKKWDWIKIIWIASLLILGYFLFLTNSRTGAMMGIASVLLFYRQRLGRLIRLGLFISVLLALVFSFQSPEFLTSNNTTPTNNRFLSTENTRETVWAGMWSNFVNYPIFGAPLYGDRLGFAESTWLATGANIGLIGFIPLVIMGLGCLNMMLKLQILSTKKPVYFLHTSVVIAGLSCLLVGSFTEAILLGNLSFPVMSLIMHLSLGKYLLDLDKMQNRQFL